MLNGEARPIEVWVEDDEDFGAGDGSLSKRATAWNVEDDGKGGRELGDVERTDAPTMDGTAAVVTLVLRFNGTDFPPGTVLAKGALPYDGGASDVRSGLLAITGGTGGHARIRGVLEVDSRNPKKYRQIP